MALSFDCHPAEQQARQEQLDAAYIADGREDPHHPHHATYTALMAKEQEPPSLEDLLAQWWRESFPNAPINNQTAALMTQFGAWLLQQHSKTVA